MKKKERKGLIENNYNPILSEESNLEAKCTIKELSTEKYRFDIDQDPTNGIIYLNVGYDDLKDIDSPVYLNYKDAFELAKILLHYCNIASTNDANGYMTREFVKDLKMNLMNNNIKWLSVYPIRKANQDYFHGAMLLDIKYYTYDNIKPKFSVYKTFKGNKKYKNSIKYSARILSCDFIKETDKCLTKELEEKLKNQFNIEKINLHTDQFDFVRSTFKKR